MTTIGPALAKPRTRRCSPVSPVCSRRHTSRRGRHRKKTASSCPRLAETVGVLRTPGKAQHPCEPGPLACREKSAAADETLRRLVKKAPVLPRNLTTVHLFMGEEACWGSCVCGVTLSIREERTVS